ncbi:MAG: YfhO family protein [Anaerolineae bacterium]
MKSTSEATNPAGVGGTVLLKRLYPAALLLLVILWPLVFYWRATLGTGLFYFGDIARFFYPTRLLYAQALQAGRLPLWTPEILLGFPLFAEMQTGALYPLHLLLYRLLPIDLAINYDILFHLAWLGAGMFLWARGRGLSAAGAAIAAFAFSAGGFGAGRITHMSVLSVAAWLPWALLMYDRWHRAPRLRYWVGLVAIWGMQFLAGHPQFMLLNVMTFGVYALGNLFGWVGNFSTPARRSWRVAAMDLLPVLAVALGAGIAAVQLLPTAELAQASARAGGVTEDFFVEFSYHPFYLALLFDPFILGNPYPRVSVEVIAYFGALPLLLAARAVILRRTRETWFWVAVVLTAFLFALGGYTPVYRALRYLPVLNLFRVPARFLFPLALAVALLAGMGFDRVRDRLPTDTRARSAVLIGVVSALLAGVIIVLASLLDVDTWVSAWRVLPFLFWGAALLAVIWAWLRRAGTTTWTALALGLTVVDLAAFGAVYAQSYNVVAPRQEVFGAPRVLAALSFADGARERTSEWIFPWVSGMRESLFPNLNAAYNAPGAQGYTPLAPRRTQTYLDQLSPRMFNLIGGRYYLVPQVLPVDPPSEAADLTDPFMIHPISETLRFLPTEATGIEVESSMAQSVDLRDGDVVADVIATTDDGRTLSVPLRAGIDTAEWAYERSDVRRVVKHSEPRIASTFPARSAFPVEAHPGHTFLGTLSLSPTPVRVTSLHIQPRIPAGLLYIQRLVLTDGDSRVNVAYLVGKGDHRLIYRSEDVAVFENPDYAPRVWITHNATVVPSDDAALARLQAPDYQGELLLADGAPGETDEGQRFDETATIVSYEPERVLLQVHAAADGYVVLADAWDAGWKAFVDNQPAPVHRADLILRAVQVTPGDHKIEFRYAPFTFYAGLVISGISLAVLGIVIAGAWLWRYRSNGI